MRLFNPEPDFLTSKSFAFQGAGCCCYAFIQSNQCVKASCYMRYNVALRIYHLFSNGYIRLLQNIRSRAYMRVCTSAHAYTRAPTRVHSCYIATFRFKYINNKEKRVAGSCSRDVVCCSFADMNKILPVYSAEKIGREMNGAGGRNGRTAGREMIERRFGGIFKKWRISAVFCVLLETMFNAQMFNVIQKAKSSADFKQVRTFFLRMFRSDAYAVRSPGEPPKTMPFNIDVSGSDFFPIFQPYFCFWRPGGGLISNWYLGIEGICFFWIGKQ